MRISLAYSPYLLQHRGGLLDFDDADKGMTGSELGLMRLSEELSRDHRVTIYMPGEPRTRRTRASGQIKIEPFEDFGKSDADLCLSFNDPRPLANVKSGYKVCAHWINSFEFAGKDFWEHVDLWLSPSRGHLDYILSKTHEIWNPLTGSPYPPEDWYTPDPTKWDIVELGCDPDPYRGTGPKIPGRVVYTSSPDRGLHHLLGQWPRIKRQVPHASLKIFYRVREWIDGFANLKYYPAIEGLRSRALYIEECLRRMSDPRWDITVCDSIPRHQLAKELAEAEVLAYPCDPINAFTEGFSCSLLEGCAAKACPITTKVDALASLYDGVLPMVNRGEWNAFGAQVVAHLKDKSLRDLVNERAYRFALERRWYHTAKNLLESISRHRFLMTEEESKTFSSIKFVGYQSSSPEKAQ